MRTLTINRWSLPAVGAAVVAAVVPTSWTGQFVLSNNYCAPSTSTTSSSSSSSSQPTS